MGGCYHNFLPPILIKICHALLHSMAFSVVCSAVAFKPKNESLLRCMAWCSLKSSTIKSNIFIVLCTATRPTTDVEGQVIECLFVLYILKQTMTLASLRFYTYTKLKRKCCIVKKMRKIIALLIQSAFFYTFYYSFNFFVCLYVHIKRYTQCNVILQYIFFCTIG